MTIGKKILGGFTLLVTVVLVVAGVGWFSLIRSERVIEDLGTLSLPAVQHALAMEVALEESWARAQGLLNPRLTLQMRRAEYAGFTTSRERFQQARSAYAGLAEAAGVAGVWTRLNGELPALERVMDELLRQHQLLDQSGILNPNELVADLHLFRGDLYAFEMQILDFMDGADFAGTDDLDATAFGRWARAYQSENSDLLRLIELALQRQREMYAVVEPIRRAVAEEDTMEYVQLHFEVMRPAALAAMGHFAEMHVLAGQSLTIYQRLQNLTLEDMRRMHEQSMQLLTELVYQNDAMAVASVSTALQRAAVQKSMGMGLALLGSLLGALLGYLIHRNVTVALNRTISNLTEGADSTSRAATEINAASQTMAEGASEQAASLEQTSASMDELRELVSRNAAVAETTMTHAHDANVAVQQGVTAVRSLRGKVGDVSAAVSEMDVAMREIKASSGSISKIIKTIDEIAFQTNILALNAAVEAARAGEAGAGFAVVADEVRSLARRAADAARETGSLIDDSVARSQRGVETNAVVGEHLNAALNFAKEADQALNRITDTVRSVNTAMGTVERSVREQQTGIGQINQAIEQINAVTQRNAANAQETASASQQLNQQTDVLLEVVAILRQMVQGNA